MRRMLALAVIEPASSYRVRRHAGRRAAADLGGAPQARPRPASLPERRRRADDGPPAAAVVSAGAVLRYFAAIEQGYYAAENLDVRWVSGGGTIAPQTVGSQPDGPEFTIAWQPKVLQAREAGSNLVNIAQIFQRSGTLSVSWKESNITGRPTSRARRSASGTSATSSRSLRGPRRPGSSKAPTTPRSSRTST